MKGRLISFAAVILAGVIGLWLGFKTPCYIAPLTPTPAQAPLIGVPERLSIPKLGINVFVEQVGLDSQHRMDVPKNTDNAGWYDLGYKPGEEGNAVIDGHLDTLYGPSIFYNLENLTMGDEIFVTDDTGRQLIFIVTSTASYPFDQVPLQAVFGPSDKPHLNLITCGGGWDSVNKNYSNRIVVYSDLTAIDASP